MATLSADSSVCFSAALTVDLTDAELVASLARDWVASWACATVALSGSKVVAPMVEPWALIEVE